MSWKVSSVVECLDLLDEPKLDFSRWWARASALLGTALPFARELSQSRAYFCIPRCDTPRSELKLR
jgi:hypothetical protein